MAYDVNQSIAAVASAPGGAARGVVRMSGPDVLDRLGRCFSPADGAGFPRPGRRPRRIAGSIRIDATDASGKLVVAGELLYWQTERSYTRQCAAEFHTIGSPPVLAAIMEQLARVGIRAAGPGEFTLRAFLAGRIDLTQAEAVLGVIDAQQRSDLDAALDQLAGGLSRPLKALRIRLLHALAELEAGLDFVEEDIEFISREALGRQLGEARCAVEATLAQLAQRDRRREAPRVALVGPPNAGKSSLFNALVARHGAPHAVGAIVSHLPGTTRDYVVAQLELDGLQVELIDTAGEQAAGGDEIHHAAQQATAQRRREAELLVHCRDGSGPRHDEPTVVMHEDDLTVLTKADLAPRRAAGNRSQGVAPHVVCSSITGEGLVELATLIRARLGEERPDAAQGGVAGLTAARCSGSLREAADRLRAATALLDEPQSAGDELIAAEIRSALDALGAVAGEVSTDDVLDLVFSKFCIGK